MLGHFCLAKLKLSSLLNKVQFTFEVVPCLILGLFRQFFTGVHQFWPSITKGWVGERWGVGREVAKPPVKDMGPPVTLRWS